MRCVEINFAVFTGYSYIFGFLHLRLLYCYIPWCVFSSRIYVLVSTFLLKTTFFKTTNLEQRFAHIRLCGVLAWRPYVVHLPRSFEEQKSRAALWSWGRNSFIDQGICQNKWSAKIRASFPCSFWWVGGVFWSSRALLLDVWLGILSYIITSWSRLEKLVAWIWIDNALLQNPNKSKKRCSASFHWRHVRKPSKTFCVVFLSFHSNRTSVFSTTRPITNCA